jgi:hypothetical protein
MRNKLFILIFAIIMALPCAGFAAPEMKDARIGDVTKFTGDVLVRTNGNWKKLAKTPYPIYSSDKVVTNRGRAEVSLTDGGILKMDTDSNISISRSAEQSGIIFKKTVASRQVNVLIGNVWFDVKMKKEGDQLKFKTPEMVAAIKGTVGGFDVAPDGNTGYGLSEGEAETSGNFTPNDNPAAPDVTVLAANLPPSDPAAANSEVQQTANEAVKNAQTANQAGEAAKNQSKQVTKGDPIGAANASVAKAEAAKKQADAKVSAAKDAVAEARRLGKGLSIAEQNLTIVEDAASQAGLALQKTNEWAIAVTNAPTAPAAQAAASAAQAYASQARAKAAIASAHADVAELAVSDENSQALTSAQNVAAKTISLANQGAAKLEIVTEQAEAAAEAITNVAAQAAATAAAANASAVRASAEAVRANANINKAISSGSSEVVAFVNGSAGSAEGDLNQTIMMAEKASVHAAAAANATTEVGARVALAAAKATSLAAQIYAASSEGNAFVALAMANGDTEKAAQALAGVHQLSENARKAGENSQIIDILATDPAVDPETAAQQAEYDLQGIEELANSAEEDAIFIEDTVNEFSDTGTADSGETSTDTGGDTGGDTGADTGGSTPPPAITIPDSGGGGGGDSNPASPT